MNSHLYDWRQVHDFAQLHVSSVAPGSGVEGLAFLPFVVWKLTRRVPVSTVIVASMFAVAALTPPVIGNHHILKKHTGCYVQMKTANKHDKWNTLFHLDWTVVVEPGQELGGVPVGIWCIPVPIRPDQIGFVRRYKVHKLWKSFTGNKLLRLESGGFVQQVKGIVPFIQRVVEAQVQWPVCRKIQVNSQSSLALSFVVNYFLSDSY